MLVALRATIGWHFLYEGVWKIANAEKFSATPYLVQAKGPAADLFYAMVYDIDGRQRLAVEKDAAGQPIRGRIYIDSWNDLLARTDAQYKLSDTQKAAAEVILNRYADSAKSYLKENAEAIAGYFNSLDRFEEEKRAGNDGAEFQKKRRWDRQEQLRAEVGGWLGELDRMQADYHEALWNLLDDSQKAKGPLPVGWDRQHVFNVVMSWSLVAIGFCLIAGLGTRLACLGGAGFLAAVLLTQPPWPTIYPPAPAVVGHALVVDKNFVEMIALFMLAAMPVGRWGGLDYFLYYWFGRPILARVRQGAPEEAS